MVEDEKYKIGSRIECDGYRGTVKYVGLVGNTKGQWLGIDWDDECRGKHNGIHEGVEYFKTRHPTSGSFVRPEKVKLGISCPEAIKIRYGFVDDELAGVNRENLSSLQKKINAPVEVVGFSKVNKKQSKFDQLKTVWLREQCVSHAGEPGQLQQLCPNLEALDLSKNLISSWKAVAEICSQLPALTTLNVSENYLPMEENLEYLKYAFLSVRDLTIARMHYDWNDIENCVTMFPALKELSVSFNIVKIIREPLEDSNIMKLRHLILEANLITSWNEILKLGCLPHLQSLNINSNQISQIRFPTQNPTDKTDLFRALKQLNISDNNISEWQSVRELEKLLTLEDLKFRGNPILKTVSAETAFQYVIASISTLKFFNGHKIQDQERRGAEYDYLKLFAKQWIESENNEERKNEFLSAHPRYPILIKKYGKPEIPAPQTKTEMASNVITVEFICPNDSNQPKGVKRKLLKDMNVQKVIGLAQRLFQTGRKIPQLSFIRHNLSKDEIPLDKPLQQLGYYSIESGDQILVRW